MPYSLDLRQKVVNFVENGGKITDAAHIFKVGRASIYRWLGRQKLEATKVNRRQRKLDWKGLEKDVKENPEAKLADRAKKFGVTQGAIFYALKKMKITRKKQQGPYRERNREERIKYYQKLQELIIEFGSKSLVFIDESGFDDSQNCILAGSKRGKKVYGEKQGKRGKRKSLVAGRRKKEKDLIAPMLFTGSLNAEGFEGWLNQYLGSIAKIMLNQYVNSC